MFDIKPNRNYRDLLPFDLSNGWRILKQYLGTFLIRFCRGDFSYKSAGTTTVQGPLINEIKERIKGLYGIEDF